MKLICFDIGGTNIKFGIVKDSVLLLSDMMATNAYKGAESIFDSVLNKARELDDDSIDGISISCCGVIDNINGLIYSSNEMIEGFSGYNISDKLSVLNKRVIVENDVNCFMICERMVGNLIDSVNSVMITIGTGIGGSFCINKELYFGASFSAGEVGQMYIDNGNSFEQLASISALVDCAKDKGLDVNNGVDVFKLYDNGDSICQDVVKEFYYYLSVGLSNIICMFNPDKIVIGGAITNRKTFINELQESFNRVCPKRFVDSCKLEIAKYYNESGLLGAYYNYIKNTY